MNKKDKLLIEDFYNNFTGNRLKKEDYVNFIDEYGLHKFSRDLVKYQEEEYSEDDWRMDYAVIMAIYHNKKLELS